MSAKKPEEWRQVAGWPGLEVSSLGRVRRVRYVVGENLTIRAKGRQLTTTASALYKKAFGQEPLASGSRVQRRTDGELWQLVRRHALLHGVFSVEGLTDALIQDDKERGVKTSLTSQLRQRVFKYVTRYRENGLIERVAYGTYQLTQKGKMLTEKGRAR